MFSVNDFRTGITIELEGNLYTVVDFQHVKPGKGAAFVRSKLKNIKTGYSLEKTFRGGEKVMRAVVERRPMQFLYSSGDDYTFMDNENYEQITLDKQFIGEGTKWMKDSTEVSVLLHNDTPIGIDLPNFVDLKVTVTEPGFKGDTATGASKPATLETGAVINVPLFINEGDVLQIDTRTGEYLKRVN
ncbi:MAG: elongation factor P [Proteobacteria bacterium]|nr:elongation factor P [Pseudomonadota bacterium]